MEENYSDGVLNGDTKVWYLSGEVKYEGRYKDGKPDGTWNFYDENGKKTSSMEYNDGLKK